MPLEERKNAPLTLAELIRFSTEQVEARASAFVLQRISQEAKNVVFNK